MEGGPVDLAPWLSVLRELGFTAVAGFLVWCAVRMIQWLLERNRTLSDQLLQVVERNSEALEKLKTTLDARPCLKREDKGKAKERDNDER